MTETLYRLVYYSSNLIQGSADEIDKILRDILSAARRKNPVLGVTGALMFNTSCFIQVIEGPRAAVENLFQQIRGDKRHKDITLLTLEPIARRSFENWSMAFVGARDAEGRLAALASESGCDPAGMSGETTTAFLRALMLAQEQAAA